MKKCKKCNSYNIKKNGKKLGKQRYLCKDCNYVWARESNPKIGINLGKKLLHEVVINNQTYRSLSAMYGVSKPTIQSYIDEYDYKKNLMIR